MVTPTLLDVAATLGLPTAGDDIPSLYSFPVPGLGINFSKSTSGYSNFLANNVKSRGAVTNAEHNAFLLYWFSKYFLCSSSVAAVQELQLYVALAISDGHFSWGTLFLSYLCRCLYTILDRL